VILCDTGPLVAIINANDPEHLRCRTMASRLKGPLATTEACLTEALYMLGRATGWRGQEALWRLVGAATLQILTPPADGPMRAQSYMNRFRDLPCDYADATLLVVSEDSKIRQVFTLDGHFHAYRLIDGSSLDVIPLD
jgi:uncharacterized protein